MNFIYEKCNPCLEKIKALIIFLSETWNAMTWKFVLHYHDSKNQVEPMHYRGHGKLIIFKELWTS